MATFDHLDRVEQNGISPAFVAICVLTDGSVSLLKFDHEPTPDECRDILNPQLAQQAVEAETKHLIEFARLGNDPRMFAFSAISPLDGFRALLRDVLQSDSEDAMQLLAVARDYTVEGLSLALGIESGAAQAIVDWIAQLSSASDALSEAESVRLALVGAVI